MKEVTIEHREIQLIPTKWTSLVLAERRERANLIREKRKKRDQAITRFEIMAAASLLLNMVQAVIIYFLRPI